MQGMTRATSLFCTALLSACGGGSDNSTVMPPARLGELVISSTNSKAAAADSYSAAMQSGQMGDFVGAGGIAFAPAGGLAKPSPGSSAGSSLQSLLQKVPLGPDTQACGVSGTVTISGNIANPLTLTPGDAITALSADCDDGLGEVINGTMRLVIGTFSGDLLAGMYLLVVDVELVDFSVQTAADTVTTNGSSTVTLDTSGLPLVSMSIAGDSLTNASSADSETIFDFVSAHTIDTSVSPEPHTLDASGHLSSSELNGSVSYATPLMFQGLGANYPYAGELLVTGANGATVRLVTLDEFTVRIDTDADGDGVPESSEIASWDDIAG
jgi:hypothetical protein